MKTTREKKTDLKKELVKKLLAEGVQVTMSVAKALDEFIDVDVADKFEHLLDKEQLEEMRWRAIDGYQGKYAISDYGHVKNVITKNSLKLTKNMYGYMITHLSDRDTGKSKGIRVHRLVGRYFIPNPMLKPCINHLDGNKQNNHFSNLEWCTDSENKLHAFRTGLNHGPNKIRIGQYTLEGKLIREYESICEASRQTGVPVCEIWRTSSFKPKIGKYLYARGFRWKKFSTLKDKP